MVWLPTIYAEGNGWILFYVQSQWNLHAGEMVLRFKFQTAVHGSEENEIVTICEGSKLTVLINLLTFGFPILLLFLLESPGIFSWGAILAKVQPLLVSVLLCTFVQDGSCPCVMNEWR